MPRAREPVKRAAARPATVYPLTTNRRSRQEILDVANAVAQPLRAALTGKTTSPPIFDVLAVLGREESLARLRDVVAAP